jgi:hypothetical protein
MVVTALLPTLFSAAQEVSAEAFGAVDAITTSFDDKGVAVGGTVLVPYAPAQSNTAFTPAAVSTAGTDVTASTVAVTITKSQKNSMVLTGEQQRSLENGGNYQEWVRQWSAQAMRALRNEAEADACLAIKYGASRAYGSAATTPFATSLADLNNVRKILRDNGAPMTDLQFVGNTDTELNLLNLGIIQQAYAAGSDAERRSGMVGRQFGFKMGTSAGIAQHVLQAGSNYVTDANGGTQPVGDTSFVVDTGSTVIAAGDIFSIADAGSHKYVVATGMSTASDSTPLTINRPGLRVAAAQNKALTFTASYTPNFAFEKSAVVGIMRPPLFTPNATTKTMLVSDGFGLTYLFVELQQYGQTTWEMHLAWGFKVVQSEHVAILIG